MGGLGAGFAPRIEFAVVAKVGEVGIFGAVAVQLPTCYSFRLRTMKYALLPISVIISVALPGSIAFQLVGNAIISAGVMKTPASVGGPALFLVGWIVSLRMMGYRLIKRQFVKSVVENKIPIDPLVDDS
jgi:hypothetical protein